MITGSSLSFRFGGSRTFCSLGRIVIQLGIPCDSLDDQSPAVIQCAVAADIVDSNIPRLVSRHALRLMRCSLDLARNSLSFEGYKIQLTLAENGHLLIPYQIPEQSDVAEPQYVFVGETSDNRVDSPELIR